MKIYELSLSELTKMIVSELEKIGNLEVVLENPIASSKFPCSVVNTPLQSIEITEDAIPVRTNISVLIDCWDNTKYKSMQLLEKVDKKMRNINFIRTNMPIDQFDSITKKYRIGGSYEAFFNGLTNALERRR